MFGTTVTLLWLYYFQQQIRLLCVTGYRSGEIMGGYGRRDGGSQSEMYMLELRGYMAFERARQNGEHAATGMHPSASRGEIWVDVGGSGLCLARRVCFDTVELRSSSG